ncbi:MAG: hypothetical protein ACREDM_02920 [Methylocella sp.]
MALIQMWPQNQGLRNSISFDGRTYSSIPGVSIQVPDFDMAVLQASGWTAYQTIAGKATITMLPPADGVHLSLSFNGRSYSSTPGVSIEVQPFDAPILQANGWILVQLTVVTLQTLTLSAATFRVGAPQGTEIGKVQGTTAGSSLSLSNSDSGAVQLVSGVIQVGPTPPSPGTFKIQITETLMGATNSPNATTLSVAENATGSGPTLIANLNMTQRTLPLAA